ncbi:MAG: serine acetyltransferase [Bacteroidia bacterium]|nr:serine acetyltransferase [Bacteroidia bacterium]
MEPSFYQKIYQAHQAPKNLPGTAEIDDFINHLLQFLFPELNNQRYQSQLEIETQYQLLQLKFEKLLYRTEACHNEQVGNICECFFSYLESVYDLCLEDSKAILRGDPAAKDNREVIRSYPGFFAIAVYRIAHLMFSLDIPYLPRIFTEYAHSRTGVDIHPAACIGECFFIDHATGIVIGETTEIGNHVKLYQGVTLGALSVSKSMARQKRHPTIEDNVIIYAGATILGGETVIGKNAIIGGNVWITKSVPPNTMVYYHDGKQYIKEV